MTFSPISTILKKVCDRKRAGPTGPALQFVKKVPDGPFCLRFSRRAFCVKQNAIPEKAWFSGFFRRRIIVFEAGLAPSSSPAALSSYGCTSFFDNLQKRRACRARRRCFFLGSVSERENGVVVVHPLLHVDHAVVGGTGADDDLFDAGVDDGALAHGAAHGVGHELVGPCVPPHQV